MLIAIIAITLSVAVMISATALISGFKTEISHKIFGFWGHIHILNFEDQNSIETKPVNLNQDFYAEYKTETVKLAEIERTPYRKRETRRI